MANSVLGSQYQVSSPSERNNYVSEVPASKEFQISPRPSVFAKNKGKGSHIFVSPSASTVLEVKDTL